jgi:acyl dehydratase
MRFFEDFTPGDTLRYGGITVSAEDLIGFAEIFDAQDFHTDAEKAKASFVGELIGSGWHSCALMMRMMAEGFMLHSTSMGAPGIEELKWRQPVRPGDTLSMRHAVLAVKESRSRPEIGLVQFRFEMLNQHEEVVQEAVNWVIFGRKGKVEPPLVVDPSAWPVRYAPPAGIGAMEPPDGAPQSMATFETLEPGASLPLGAFTFGADDIMAFARAYDPQRFHVDDAAARASLFGGLCASGWHTAAAWMRLLIAARRRAAAAGLVLPGLGPSPGFKNLTWTKPVFAGDTLHYAMTVTAKRASASRPGWGLVFHRNTGVNQKGETVFAFDGCVFWER